MTGAQSRPARRAGSWTQIAAAVSLVVPALMLRFDLLHLRIEVGTLFFGLAILGAAFLLTWGAEVAELDISQALAIAFLAFIAVLPEYAVDLVFAWKAGAQDAAGGLAGAKATLCGVQEQCRQLAIANMTGANRLLIGVGWAVVVLLWWRKSGEPGLRLGTRRRTELGFLFLATMWALTIPIRGWLGMVDMAVLGSLFAAYLWRAARQAPEPPALVGPPLAIAALPVWQRRAVTIVMFLFASAVIVLSAEPFADGLVHTGEKLGISSFLLVQWLAPLASEAPEMIIAILLVLRMRPGPGMGALVSSKVNQWTLLVATLPMFYAISLGSAKPLHLDGRQVEEVLLTAAQSAFAIAVLANLTISRAEALGLLVLFAAQFGFESTAVRYGFSAVYLALFVLIFVTSRPARQGLWLAVKDALQPPWSAVHGTADGESGR